MATDVGNQLRRFIPQLTNGDGEDAGLQQLLEDLLLLVLLRDGLLAVRPLDRFRAGVELGLEQVGGLQSHQAGEVVGQVVDADEELQL